MEVEKYGGLDRLKNIQYIDYQPNKSHDPSHPATIFISTFPDYKL